MVVVGAWGVSILVVMVLGVWGAIATGYWQALAIAWLAAAVQLIFALIARWRIKRSADPFHSWWTVIVFAGAVPLLLCNYYIIVLTGGRIFPR